MKKLFAKVVERRLNLIELLSYSNTPLTIKEISSQLDISEHNIKNDLNYLKEHYEEFELLVVDDKVFFQFKLNLNLQYLYNKILDNNLTCQLIETSFFHHTLSITELAQLHHASESTIYRSMKLLDQILADYFSLSISTNPFKIEGEEKRIRQFYSQFFSERYNHYHWLFDSHTESIVDNFLSALYKSSGFAIDYGVYNNFKIVVLINLYRYKQGCMAERTFDYNKETVFNLISCVSEKDLEAFEKAFLIKIHSKNIQEIFGGFIHPAILYSKDQLNKVLESSHSNQEWRYLESITFLTEAVETLEDQFSIKAFDQPNIILNTHNANYLTHSETNILTLFSNRKERFVQLFRDRYPDFTHAVLDILGKYQKQFSTDHATNINYLYHLAYNFIVTWEGVATQLTQNSTSVKAIILSDLDLQHQNMIKNFINLYFDDELDIETHKNLKIDWQAIEASNYDLIITTFPVETVENSTVFCISDFPTYFELHRLVQLIHQINTGHNPSHTT